MSTGRLVVVTGLPGSGKTTLAKELTSAEIDELWRRITQRDLEGRWGSRSITRQELEEWSKIYQPPTGEELATYDPPNAHVR